MFLAQGPAPIPGLPVPDTLDQTASLTQVHGARYDPLVRSSDYIRIGGFGMRNFAYYQKMLVVIADITLNFAAFDKKTNRWDLGDNGQATVPAEVRSRVVSVIGGSMRTMTEDGGGRRTNSCGR